MCIAYSSPFGTEGGFFLSKEFDFGEGGVELG